MINALKRSPRSFVGSAIRDLRNTTSPTSADSAVSSGVEGVDPAPIPVQLCHRIHAQQ